jgi:DNA polymerase III subunit epsilon
MNGPLAIVDVETTGSDPARDRITEIAVLEVSGFALTAQWSTLVNPGGTIPGSIQALTGITQEMVESAPRFAHIAAELYERLAGRVFVAHNARFDYGFLRREFDRAGLKYLARTLCTVRLSRRLYPGAQGHDLDSLIERHGLECEARHRAAPDAAALWQFLCVAAADHGEDVLEVAARQVSRQPTLPPHLERGAVDAIPDAPGVYLFYDSEEKSAAPPLYIGKSRAMRSRVLQHFIAGSSWTPRVRRIEWQRTAGELGALLREAALIKELDPVYNRQLRRPGQLCGFAFDGRRLRLARGEEIDAETLPFVYGLWRSRAAAMAALRAAADEHRLCLQTLGFDVKRQGACLRHQMGRCAGVCAGKENIHVHHARVATALAGLKSAAWPHRGPLGVVEHDGGRDATEVHVLDRWCYLGTASCDSEVAELLEERRPRFDYDHYRILARHLGKRGVRVVPLAA